MKYSSLTAPPKPSELEDQTEKVDVKHKNISFIKNWTTDESLTYFRLTRKWFPAINMV